MSGGNAVHAMVLSGGGAFAAYEVGVLQALLRGESASCVGSAVDPEIAAGTSAGAFNAALLAALADAPGDAAAAELERVWLHEVADDAARCGDGGVFRWRGNPANFFGIECLANNPAQFFSDRLQDALFFARDFVERGEYIARSRAAVEQRLFESFDVGSLIATDSFPAMVRRVFRFEDIRRSRRRLRIVATNFDLGEVAEFGNQDMSDENGALILMASAAIPGIFPAVTFGGTTYVDGGVLLNTPLAPAIRSGADVLHVVYLDPDVRTLPIASLRTTLGTLQRILAISTAANFNHDIDLARRINRGLDVLGDPHGHSEREMVEALGHALPEPSRRRRYRKVTIHRYSPRTLLGGALEMLDFRADSLRELIRRGYEDASAHDCAAEGCVLGNGHGRE